jgi:UDP-N-acetylmuramyl pentapeptide phosphotransferase/UDP-N-acetylglucosamine-1-phosphate transferase
LINVALFAVAGLAAGWLLRLFLHPVFRLPLLARENYRGRSVATAAGIVVVLAVLFVEGARAVLASFDVGDPITTTRSLVLFAVMAFGLLGLIDDVVGTGHAQGFRGHVGELVHGRLTTGGIKLLGGAAVALVIASDIDGSSPGHVIVDAALIALAANLANQLDRRPGRVTKVAILAFVALAATAVFSEYLEGVAVVVGATAALIVDDLHERVMLGDTGANVVGAALGLAAVFSYSFGVRLGLLVAVAALNLLGELSSFTRLIDAVPPLRALDRAGRRDP